MTDSQESSSSTSKKTTHSEKKTTTKKETTTHKTQSSAKTTQATSAASTTTAEKNQSSSSQSTPTTSSDIAPSTTSSTAFSATSSVTSSSPSSKFDNSSSSSAVPTTSSVMSNTAAVKSMTSSSALSSSSVAAESASSSSSSSSGAIAGGVVAVVAVAVIGSAALLFVRRKRRRELKQSRAARMSTRADPYTDGYGDSEPKPYTDYQNMPPAPQPAYNEANNVPMAAAATVASYGTYEPALVPDNHSKEMIEQQQQQYYQSQTSVVEPSLSPMVPPVVVSPSGPQETPQTPSLGTFTVIATYIPTLSDELEIEPGDRIELLVEYDDGWCQGINVTKNYTKGVFPRHCIDYETAPSEHSSNADIERTKRVSSMYVTGPN